LNKIKIKKIKVICGDIGWFWVYNNDVTLSSYFPSKEDCIENFKIFAVNRRIKNFIFIDRNNQEIILENIY
jgi:hypothetical protein